MDRLLAAMLAAVGAPPVPEWYDGGPPERMRAGDLVPVPDGLVDLWRAWDDASHGFGAFPPVDADPALVERVRDYAKRLKEAGEAENVRVCTLELERELRWRAFYAERLLTHVGTRKGWDR